MFYTRIEQRFDNILLRAVDNKGNKVMHKIKYKPYIYTNHNDKETQDAVDCVHKSPLKRLEFPSIRAFSNHIKTMSRVEGYNLYGNKKPASQFAAKYFQGETKWDIEKINGAIIDIEYFPAAKNEIGEYRLDENGDFVMLRMADDTTATTPFPVNAVTVYNWNEKVFYTFGLEVLDDKPLGTYKHDTSHAEVGACEVIYRGFTTEKALLMHLALHLEANAYDFYSGWNFKCFDLPYLINRTNLVCGESYSKKYSPWGILNEIEVRGEYSSRISYEVFGVAILDYQDILKKHGFMNPDNWKLSTVSQYILGKDKLDAGSDFINDYLNHYQNFIEYNIQDVNLVAQIDVKKNFFSLLFAMAYISNSNYDDMLTTIKPWSNYLYTAYHGIGQEPLLKKIPNEVPVLDGGYVKEPQKGFHKWIMSFDFGSLYPHLMQMYNMGIETIVNLADLKTERAAICAELQRRKESN